MTEEAVQAEIQKLRAELKPAGSWLLHHRLVDLAIILALLAFFAWKDIARPPALGVPAVATPVAGFVQAPPTVQPVTVRVVLPETPKAQKLAESIGVTKDSGKELIAAPAEDKRPAGYGEVVATVHDVKTGAVEQIVTPRDPVAAFDNDWSLGAFLARTSSQRGYVGRLDWEPVSFRLPKAMRDFRLFLHLGVQRTAFPGRSEDVLLGGLGVRRK